MTVVTKLAVVERTEARPASLWRWCWTGPVAGLVVGICARAWMRWIAVAPEFTWTGTIAIVVAFVVFFTAQATARVARVRARSPRRVAGVRAVAGVLSFGLFGAAGAVMFPTVLFGSVASWRWRLRRIVRFLLAVAALPGALFVISMIVADHGWSGATVGRIVVFAAIYVSVIAATRPTVEAVEGGWVASRRAMVLAMVSIVCFVVVALYFGGVE